MDEKIKDRKIVIVNQAVNYLTIDIANAFSKKFEAVTLITGSIHTQGENLDKAIRVKKIIKWIERPAAKKLYAYVAGTISIYFLLLIKYRKHEVIFISIPPMGYLLTILLPQKASMLIWDVYPDVFKITGMKESHPLYRSWACLNRIAFKKAFRIFTIGERMAELVGKYVRRDKILITPIWSIFQSNDKVAKEENPFVQKQRLQEKFVVQYSGNIGLTHKVEVMVAMAKLLKGEPHIIFQIIGRGSRVPILKQMVQEHQLTNCEFLSFQSDDMFPYSLSAADIGVVILDGLTSKGSVPSKSYNLMSFGIPSLYIASQDSELYGYIEKYQHGKCFNENQLQQAADFIVELSNNKDLQQMYSKKSLAAATNYKRKNAASIVDFYLHH